MRNDARRIEKPQPGESAETSVNQPRTMIMIVANDSEARRSARLGLVKQGFEVGEADSDEKAILRLKMIDFDIVLLDADDRGAELIIMIRRLRELNPGVLIFAQGTEISEERQIRAFNAGMNDFFPKPINPRLFAAKAAAAMHFRRIRHTTPDGLIRFGDITLDPVRYIVRRNGVPIHVSIQEFKVLKLLMENPGHLLEYARIGESLWGDTSSSLRTRLRVLINNLRKKLEPSPSNPRYILTEMCLGYRFSGER